MKKFMLALRNGRSTRVATVIAVAGLAAVVLGGLAFTQTAPTQTTKEPTFACSINVPRARGGRGRDRPVVGGISWVDPPRLNAGQQASGPAGDCA